MHGFADYFFQTAYAEWWTERGYDFYALDLRKYGRSLLPHQTPNYVTDLADYYPELDLAWDRVTAGHRHVVLSGHSTGGLTVPLWARRARRSTRAGSSLNAPWFDLQGKALGAARAHAGGAAGREAAAEAGHPPHRDRALRPQPAPRPRGRVGLRPGLEADRVVAGVRRVAGRGPPRPRRAASRPRRCRSRRWCSRARGRPPPTELGEDVHSTDIVLDVEQIRRWSPALGRHVTYVGIEGARHDVFLSREEPRARAFDELGRWLTAYVDG